MNKQDSWDCLSLIHSRLPDVSWCQQTVAGNLFINLRLRLDLSLSPSLSHESKTKTKSKTKIKTKIKSYASTTTTVVLSRPDS